MKEEKKEEEPKAKIRETKVWPPRQTVKAITLDTSKKNIAASSVDSLKGDSLQTSNTENEEVVVKKDELRYKKTLAVREINTKNNEEKIKHDSLLQEAIGVKNENIFNSFDIEFWSSPLNYKGYRMTKNKIIIYGSIAGENEIQILRYEKNIFLRFPLGIYKLEYSNEFKQLEKITDEAILVEPEPPPYHAPF